MPGSEQDSTRHAFTGRFLNSTNQAGFCIVTLLAWLASSDGHISDEEEAILKQIAEAGGHGDELMHAIRFGRLGQPGGLQLACEVAQTLDDTQRRLLLDMAIGVSLEDGYLRHTEMHILLFLADVLKLGHAGLKAAFQQITGHPFPPVGDMSSADWWRAREGNQKRAEDKTGSEGNRSRFSGISERFRALAILGLDEDATVEDIRKAYRRLAHVHHPDRYASLGGEAVEAATITFRRIRAAYDYLGGTQ